jgi:hypothetical protein
MQALCKDVAWGWDQLPFPGDRHDPESYIEMHRYVRRNDRDKIGPHRHVMVGRDFDTDKRVERHESLPWASDADGYVCNDRNRGCEFKRKASAVPSLPSTMIGPSLPMIISWSSAAAAWLMRIKSQTHIAYKNLPTLCMVTHGNADYGSHVRMSCCEYHIFKSSAASTKHRIVAGSPDSPD